MFNHLLVFILVIATGSVLANPFTKNLLKQLSADKQLGDKEMRTVQKRQLDVFTIKTPDGEETTIEILPEDGYEVEKPAGTHVCYVRSLDKEALDRNGCVEKTPLNADQVPQSVAERCGSRPMYVLSKCEDEGENRRMFGDEIQKRSCVVIREDHGDHIHYYVIC